MDASTQRKIDTKYASTQIPVCWVNVTKDKRKGKMVEEIWDMHIPEGLFTKLSKHSSEILVDKVFDPTTEDYTR